MLEGILVIDEEKGVPKVILFVFVSQKLGQ